VGDPVTGTTNMSEWRKSYAGGYLWEASGSGDREYGIRERDDWGYSVVLMLGGNTIHNTIHSAFPRALTLHDAQQRAQEWETEVIAAGVVDAESIARLCEQVDVRHS
jgi:hypothetical protein